mgnify:CR=1 FL=1
MLVVERVRAVLAVHRHAAPGGDDADHAVAGHRLAAAREAEHDVVDALDPDAAGRLARQTERLERSLRQPLGEALLLGRRACAPPA